MERIVGKVYLLLAFALAGTSVATGRILGEKLGSFTITAMSLGLLLVCLLPFYATAAIRTLRAFGPGDRRMIALQAFFGIFLFRVFLLLGVSRTSAVEAGILTGATPAITSLLALLFLREPLTGKAALGVCCTVGGIALLQGSNLAGGGFSPAHFWGNLLVLSAAASESAFNVLSRNHGRSRSTQPQIHPMVQALLASLIAFALCLIPAALEKPAAALRTIGWKEWLALAWYGLVVTAVAFAFFYAGVRRCDAYTTAAFSGVMPLSAMLLSIALLGERAGAVQWAGVVLIASGMLLIGGRQKRADPTGQGRGILPSTEK